MALNGGALNSNAVNDSFGFTSATGGGAVVSIVQKVWSIGTPIAYLEQKVGKYGTSSTDIIQIVELHASGTPTINVVQLVTATATKSIPINQLVVNQNAVDFYSRNGYVPSIYINNVKVDDDQIHGPIDIYFREGESPQLSFTLIPPRGTQDIRGYRGKAVKVNVRTSSGVTRLFTGYINEPEVEIINQKITLRCSFDIEQEVQSNVSQGFVNSVGYYNNAVFPKPRTRLQELQDRIRTVPQSIDWDPYANIQINNIAAKGSPDYTLTDSTVYRDNLQYQFSSKQRYINRVNIKAQYTFSRLHHTERTFNIVAGVQGFCDFVQTGKTPMRKDLVYSAASNLGWALKQMTFTEWYSSGYYNCGGTTIGFVNPVGKRATQTTGATTDGNTQYASTNQTLITPNSNYCLAASWEASLNFAQNIVNEFTITIDAPQSIADYGVKSKDENFNLNAEYDVGDWENYETHSTDAPTGLSVTGTSGNNFWADANVNQGEMDTSLNILMNRAKSDILKSHRDDIVTFKRSLWPQINLSHTVRINTDWLVCTGKVKSYRHVMDVNTGESYTIVDLALSRSTGSASDSTLTIPSATTVDPTYDTSTVSFSSRYGVDPEANPDFYGFSGNLYRNVRSGVTTDFVMTTYPVSCTFKTPAIDDTIRANQETTASASYNVEIPNDELTISFEDDNYV